MNEEVTQLPKRPKGYITLLVLTCSVISLLDNTLALVETAVIDLPIYGMSADFGFSGSGETQIWIGIFGVFAFFVFIIAWLTDAIGRKKGLIILVLTMGIPSLILPFTPAGPAGSIPSMALYGVLTLGTLANTWEIPITEEAPTDKRGALGATAFLIGVIPISALVSDDLAEALGSWKWAYAILGGILMAASLVLLVFMKETNRWLDKRKELKHNPLDFLKTIKKLTKKDWKYILLMILVYTIWGTCFKFASLAAQRYYLEYGNTPEEYKTYLTIAGIFLVLGALVGGIIIQKVNRKMALIVGCIESIISFILLAVSSSPIGMIALYFSMPIILSYITVYFAEIFPTDVRATSYGMAITISRSSYMIGPLLSGALIPGLLEIGAKQMWVSYWIVGAILIAIPLITILFKPYETKDKELEDIIKER